MSFIWPIMLVLLCTVPLFAGLYAFIQIRAGRGKAKSGLGFGGGAAARRPGLRRHIPLVLALLALSILLMGLARPQQVVDVPRMEGTVVLAFDVSGSMAATDFKPTRMDAAKAAAKSFIEKQPSSVQIGVVAFTDNGFSAQVPTTDKDAILAAIDRMTPQRGTSMGQGILAALKSISVATSKDGGSNFYSNRTPQPTPSPTPVPQGTYTPAVIVLLSDGNNNEPPDPLTAAQTAADRGVRINTVGIGTTAGVDLHINGFNIHTALDETTLQAISKATGGTYYNATNETDLLKIYDNLASQFTIKSEKTELTSIFAGASLLVFLAGGLASLVWFGRFP